MQKIAAKKNIKYIDKLDGECRSRYRQKLEWLNGFDPYDSTEKEWSTDVNLIPPLEFPALVSYLVCGVSAYTLQQFKCYKSLDAHMQFTDGWVQELKVYNPLNCEHLVVKAKVLHSQKLNEKPLSPWIILDKAGNVEAAHCDCMAGLAETCTHVGALLFKTEAVVRIREKTTVTGVPAYWKIPGSIEKVRPKAGFATDYTSAATRKKRLDTSIDRTAETQEQVTKRTCTVRTSCKSTPEPTQEQLDNFLASLHKTGDQAVVLSSEPNFCKEFMDPVPPVVLPKSLTCLRDSHCDNMSMPDLLEHCQKVSETVSVSAEEAHKIEKETKEQHKSSCWYSCRAGRVTASQLHSVCRFNKDRPALSTIKNVCYPGQVKVKGPAIHWGIQNEGTVRMLYSQFVEKAHVGFSVEKSGFWINPDVPYVGASPDGLVNCHCCGKGCLEIKCSYKYRNMSVHEACQNSDFCLQEENGIFQIRKNHSFIYQVQCQMFVTNTDYCDLVVWTPHDFVVTRIVRDHNFMAECLQKAEDFFKTVALPELVAKRFTLQPTQENGKLRSQPQKRSLGEILNTPTANTLPKHCRSNPRTSAYKSGKKGKNKKALWCYCKRPEEIEDMVACDNPSCKIEWFHISCVGLDQIPTEEDTWYCKECSS